MADPASEVSLSAFVNFLHESSGGECLRVAPSAKGKRPKGKTLWPNQWHNKQVLHWRLHWLVVVISYSNYCHRVSNVRPVPRNCRNYPLHFWTPLIVMYRKCSTALHRPNKASSTRAGFHLKQVFLDKFYWLVWTGKNGEFFLQVSLLKSWYASFSTRRFVKENLAYFSVHTSK